MKNKIIYLLVLLFSVIVFTGCPSSSNTSGSSNVHVSKAAPIDRAPTEITSTNTEEVVEIAISSLEFIDLDILDSFGVASANSASSNKSLKIRDFDKIIANLNNSVIPAATESVSNSEGCLGGGDFKYSRRVINKVNSEDEKMSVTFNNCRMLDDGYYGKDFYLDLDGNIEMEMSSIWVNNIEEHSFNQKFNGMKISGKDYKSEYSIIMHGDMKESCKEVNFNSENCTISTNSLGISLDKDWLRIFEGKFVREEGGLTSTLDFNYKVNSSKFKGMLHITTLEKLIYDDYNDYPSEGKIQVTGNGGSLVVITYSKSNWYTVANIEVTYADGRSCTANNITTEQLEEGSWVCN